MSTSGRIVKIHQTNKNITTNPSSLYCSTDLSILRGWFMFSHCSSECFDTPLYLTYINIISILLYQIPTSRTLFIQDVRITRGNFKSHVGFQSPLYRPTRPAKEGVKLKTKSLRIHSVREFLPLQLENQTSWHM